MKHIVDIKGDVFSLTDIQYLEMTSRLTNTRKFNEGIEEITLAIGQEWYIQQGADVNLSRFKIIRLSDKTVSMRHVDHTYVEFTREFKNLKFIERMN
jgi:hypothetical protein